MTWSTSRNVRRFLAEAGEFLRARPVEHTVLLTETAYLENRHREDQRFGWWRDAGGNVAGAFLRAPRHAPVLSPMPAEAVESLTESLSKAEAVESLTESLSKAEAIEADAETAETVAAAWKQRLGRELAELSRITLYRLEHFVAPDQPRGRARVAAPSDREVLLHWYKMLMKGVPEDPSEAEYVVDDPIGFGGITLWEVDGEPVAMAGRSRLVAGMVRLGAVYAPGDVDSYADTYANAAFVAACRAARELADHVLVFAPSGNHETAERFAALGFRPVLERVMLG